MVYTHNCKGLKDNKMLTIAFVGDIIPGGMFVKQGGIEDKVVFGWKSMEYQ